MKDRLVFTLTMLWTIAAAVTVTVLLSIPLFALDIGWEHLTAIANLPASRLMHNYNVLMTYLLNPFQAHLKMPDFPDSTSALQHFSEVKSLFLLVIVLTIILLPALVKFCKDHLYILFRRAMIVLMILPVLLAALALTIGFDNFFIGFHEILFRDNTWLFDPITDPIINVLTDNFFMYTFVLFAILYEGILATFLLRGRYAKTHR